MATHVIWAMDTWKAMYPGYTFIFATDRFIENEKDSPTEYFFNYEGRDFDLLTAVKTTKYWWGKTFGSDGIRVIDKKILLEENNRTMFMIKVIPTYKNR